MKSHRFDPLAFIFGVIFLAIGIPLAFAGSELVVFEGRWIVPVVLIVAGGVVLATTRSRSEDRDSVLSEAAVDAELESMSDDEFTPYSE